MNLVERVLYLYMWKEELATRLGKTIEDAETELFVTFGWWFEGISFGRIEPDIDDLVYFEQKFAEIEKKVEKST